jgi:hypothetical protein
MNNEKIIKCLIVSQVVSWIAYLALVLALTAIFRGWVIKG